MNDNGYKFVCGVVFLAAVGCADGGWDTAEEGSAAPEDVGATDESLVGGTSTNIRPEIGRLSVGCTATLVDPRYIVTASHCFNHTTGPRNDTFTIRSTAGVVLLNATVDFAYSYGDGVNGNDIAFGRLTAAVPAATATPATFGAWPANNAQVAAFGYGCTQRNPQSGGGFKQFVNYTFGNSTINCPGDSGGPRVLGQASASGAIWGINSGYFTDSGNDIQANASLLGPLVLRAVRAVGGTTTTNSNVADFPGWARASGVKAIAGDFDGNGRADVALVGGSGWNTIPIALGNGAGAFSVSNRTVASFPGWANSARAAVGGDFDGDGDTDIALFGGSGWNTIPIAFSNRDGTFTVSNLQTPNLPGWAQASGAYPVAGDFDADGDADVALLGGSGWNTIPMGFSNRNGTFTQTNTAVTDFPGWSRGAGARGVVGDFDADGDADIALAGGSGWSTIPVAFSNRAGGFGVTNRTVSDIPGWAAASGTKIVAGDFDGDGDADLAITGPNGWRTVPFALSDRAGGFAAANFPIADVPSWGRGARFVLAARVNSGATADLIMAGGEGWTTVPTVQIRQ